MWKFWLDDREVAEPQKWDSVTFTLRRSDALGGLELLFSDSLEFTGEGAAYLQGKFEAEGIDAKVAVRIEGYDCDEVAYRYEGRVNFGIYKANNSCPGCEPETVTVGLVQSGLTSRFKNRLEVPVNLDLITGIDGGPLTPLPYREVGLHSRELTYKSNYSINPVLTRYRMVMASTQNQDNVSPPWQIQNGEVEQTMEPTFYNPSFEQPLLYSGFTYPPGITNRTIQVSGRLRVTVTYSQSVQLSARLRLTVRGVQSQTITTNLLLGNPTIGPGSTTLEYTWNTPLNFPPDSNLFMYFEFVRVSGGGTVIGFVDFLTENSYLNYEEKSLFTPSKARGLLLGEALSRITESITGERDSFRSDFFGKGCGKWNLLTNGLSIRNARTPEGQFYPISASFQDLYNGLDAIFCLGRRIEKEGVDTEILFDEEFCTSINDNTKYAGLVVPAGYYELVLTGSLPPNEGVGLAVLRDGVELWSEFVTALEPLTYRFAIGQESDQFRLISNITGCFGVTLQGVQHEVVRVEPREYFYRNEPVVTLEKVNDVDRAVDLQAIANEFEVGFTKWESNLVGGVDEVQTKRNYVLPVENAKRKIAAMSELVTASYLLEQQRRKQFAQTTDAANDNDLFLIALNKSPVQSNKYTVDGSTVNYATGTVAERNEEFVDVEGMESPETAYNLRLTPVRMAYNWRRVLAVSTVRKANPVAKFQAGTGNVKESDLLPDSCGVTSARLVQNMDIPLGVVPLHEPEVYTFEAPLTLPQFLQLQENAIFAIAFGCGTEEESRGFIREVVYEPNENGGTANFTLIKAPQE